MKKIPLIRRGAEKKKEEKKETPENRGRRKEKKSLIEGSCQRSSKFDGVNMGEIS